MKNKKLAISITVILGAWAFWANNAFATTWYVRDGGGTPTQCTGTTNAVYPGSGTGKPCAFNHPRYAIGWDQDSPQAGTMAGGDTLYIDGDSDINPGQQAKYLIGYDDSGANGTPDCSPFWPYDCTLKNLPAGISASQPTSIIGTGSHKPQLWGNERVWQVLSADNNYITLQSLEITDHDACAFNDPSSGCNYGGPYPYGAWSEDGLYIGGTGLTFTDVYVHGLGRYGVYTDNLGNATFTRFYVIGNGYGGVSTGINATMSGTLTWNQPIVEWNGCVEAYPVSSIDSPSNYSQCFGQNSGGYGDGIAFGNVGHGAAGNWTIIGPGSISFNTQDGLDTLHGNGTGTIQIDKMRFEGNAGNQVKMNAVNAYLTNSVVIGDCGWWYGAPQAYSGFGAGDICRALGDAVLINVTNSSVAQVYNNTILSNGNIAMETEDLNGTGCNSATSVSAKNNIILGGYAWIDDTTFNGSGGNALTTFIYNDGNNGDGAGTCGSLTWNEDYNIVYNTKGNNQSCAGAHDQCGTNPGLASTIPMGTAGGAENTFYQGNSAASLIALNSSSAAIASGAAGLTYWNNSNDYHNVTRTNPPSKGGVEMSSCAVNGYGCFFNSDCCSGSCSSMVCGGASAAPQPTVSVTSPASASSFSAGASISISANASEVNGTITNVSLYNGSTLLGSSSSSVYSYTMSNAAAGTYTITAKATDANGVSVTSSAVTMTVTAQSILPSLPTVTITSPTSGINLTAGSSVTVTASGSETNGSISNIAIYNGAGVLLGSGNSSSYSYVDSNLPAGIYTFTAQVTDANGVSVTSAPVTVTVAALPVTPSSPVVAITTPVNGGTFAAGSMFTITASASETNGTIKQVAFYNDSTLLTTVTTAPYTIVWYNSTRTSYDLVAVATDANGVSTTSSTVTTTVAGSLVAPIISTQPVGITVTAPSTATFTVAAAGTPAPTYQWMQKAPGASSFSAISGATGTSYTTGTTSSANNGTQYECAVTNSAGSLTSNAAALTVTVPPSPPVVAITSPANASSATAGSSMTITANASETNGTISNVSFYNGTTLLGSDTASPYSFTVSSLSAGTYTLTAKATDTNGVSVTSGAVTVTVTVPLSPPVVSITSPANASSATAGSSMTITASASETNGTISNVSFYNGTTLLGSDTASPYSFTVSSLSAGTYNLTAKATDANGVSVTSASVSITVNAAPSAPVAPIAPVTPVVAITSPVSNASYTVPSSIPLSASASESGASIVRVDYYASGIYVGEATSTPFAMAWTSAQAGTYNLTAVATDSNGNQFTSAAVAITVNAHTAPTISLTAPANNASFTTPANMTITANAAVSGGTITKVDFYNGGMYLGTAYSSPYSFAWNNIQTGSYSLTAKATDSYGWSTTSDPVTVNVGTAPVPPSPPVVAITSPANASSATAGSSMTITASASETNGTISNVSFYNGTTLLGSDASSPYSFTVSSLSAGTYNLTAKATDTNGVTVTSSAVTVTVTVPLSPPVVAITSPANASSATAGSSMTITASASETNGTISNVSFYNGTTLLGSDASSPYSFTVNNLAAGTYNLTAKATDTNGVTVTSGAVTVTVTVPLSPPVVAITTPTNGLSLTAGMTTITANASETNGTISNVSFYNGSTLIGSTSTDPDTAFSITANLATGIYNLTAKATDANGVTVTSSPVTVTVIAVLPLPSLPVVAITSPAAVSSLTAGSSMTITASASETNGTISNVSFYNGTTLLGSDTASPYSFTVKSLSAGIYTLTAKATDANGVSVTSIPVIVTVAAAPVLPSLPVVTIVTPANNSTVTSDSNVTVTVNASETNGTIRNITVYRGLTIIGSSSSSPYSVTMSKLATGSYTLMAVATDANGVSVTSSHVTLTVKKK